MHHIHHADDRNASFSSELQDVANGFNDDVSTESLNALMDRAVQATKSALDRGAQMKQQFSNLAVEMQQVRRQLAMLLRDTPRSGSFAVAENVRLQISALKITLPEEPGFAQPVRVTVSLGGASYREREPLETLVDRGQI